MSKRHVHLQISEETYQLLHSKKEEWGVTLSVAFECLLKQSITDDVINKQNDLMLEKLKPFLVQLRTIGNETNVVSRTNKEILNYILLADNYIKEFDTNGENKDHLVTMSATEKVRDQVSYQRLIALENKRLNNEKR